MRQGRQMFPLKFALTIAATLGIATGVLSGTASAQAQPEGKNPIVVLDTSAGAITVELYPEKAPVTVANFLKYIDDGFYDNLIFHRIIDGFMIQTGGMNDQLQEKKRGLKGMIKNEAGNGLINLKGTVAMARTPDPNSAQAQFFINLVDNKFLDDRRSPYAVFGKVIGGMDVVEFLAKVQTTTRPDANGRPMGDVPVKPIYIKSAKRAKS